MLVALLVCLIPTTIGALLSAIGIAGMDRLVQRNVLAMSRPGRRGRRRRATRCCSTRPARSPSATARPPSSCPCTGVDERELAEAALLSTLADETPEGRSIVELAEDELRPRAAGRAAGAELVPFTAQTRMSGIDFATAARSARAPPTRCAAGSRSRAAPSRSSSTPIVDGISARRRHPARRDGRSTARRVLGVIHLKDIVKPGMTRALRRAARHGHPHGHDHRRQPAHRRGHRRRGRRRRLPGRGHARGQDGPHPARSRRAATSSP